MKLIFSVSASLLALLITQTAIAAPSGGIVFHNASGQTISAQVSSFGRIDLPAHERKNIAYSTLVQACSPNPTQCRAQFYINNMPAGSATINAVTGKLMQMRVIMNVHVGKSQQILRNVVIQ